MSGGCNNCLKVNASSSIPPHQPYSFSLPAPLPQWPPGEGGFANGRINLGELEVIEITQFDFVWGCKLASFFRPINVPNGFSCFGYYCQYNNKPSQPFILAGRETSNALKNVTSDDYKQPALVKPNDYILIWTPDDDGKDDVYSGQYGYFWAPQPPNGYKSLGFVVTSNPTKPETDEVRCVRSDLTEPSESCGTTVEINSKLLKVCLRLKKIRPQKRGIDGRGVPVGSFFCTTRIWHQHATACAGGDKKPPPPEIVCLKNMDPNLTSMPNLDQIHALITHYGPTMYFHPHELYFPSSVAWFFDTGALLYKKGEGCGHGIDSVGANLPAGGKNDGEYWIDLPNDKRETIKRGKLETSELYVHSKPAMGGTCTDIAMWVFYPFNGPAVLKVGPLDISLKKIGEHVGDWEHVTLRVSNFNGELRCMYFSQHSMGSWTNACDLEFVEGNRPAVYASKSGHAMYPHMGTVLQGTSRMVVGIRNDCNKSEFFVDGSNKYMIVSTNYAMGTVIEEPPWLLYMRDWGPKVVYDSKTKLDKIVNKFPAKMRDGLVSFLHKLPSEMYGQDGPSGPKEKDNWLGDERW